MTRVYHVGDAVVDVPRNCVRRGAEEHHLRPKTFSTLVYLIDHRERVVAKQELFAAIWPDAAVTDDALVQCIREIRQALGDEAQQSRFIRTIPRVGYRFVGPVTTEAAPAPAPEEPAPVVTTPPARRPAWRPRRVALAVLAAVAVVIAAAAGLRPWRGTSAPAPPAEEQVVAVFQFSNRSGDRSLDWLQIGLPDMVVTGLSRARGLSIVSRAQLENVLDRMHQEPSAGVTLERALEAARRAQARTIVLGSFVRLKEMIRIDVQLHEVATGRLIRGDSLTVAEAQLLSDVDILALRLAGYLGVRDDDPTVRVADVMTNNLEAYRAYALAVDKAHVYDSEGALRLLEKATELDPEFAMAFGRIGYIYAAVRVNEGDRARPYLEKAFSLSDRLTEKDRLYIRAWYGMSQQDGDETIARLREVVAKFPRETEAYWRLGIELEYKQRYAEAIATYERGLAMDPEARDVWNRLGFCYLARGRYDRAIPAHERYVMLDPDEPNAHDSLGISYSQAGRYTDGIAALDRALALRPRFHFALLHKGDVFFQLGRWREALDYYEQYLAVAPSDWDRAVAYNHIGIVHWRRGDLQRAAAAAAKERALRNDFGLSLRLAIARGDRDAVRALKDEYFGTSDRPARGTLLTRRDREYLRGLVAQAEGRQEEALSLFKQALAIPHVLWGINSLEDCLAEAYEKAGRTDDAIREYQRMLAMNAEDALTHYHLARLHETRDPAVARKEYEQFLRIWKDADAELAEVRRARAYLSTAASPRHP